MTRDDLCQYAAVWRFAAGNFEMYAERWRDTSLYQEAVAHRRLCDAVAEGYLQEAKKIPAEEPIR